MRAPARLALLAAMAAGLAQALPLPPRSPVGAEPGAHHPFERCAGVKDHLRVSQMDFLPDPVLPDTDLRVSIAGNADVDLFAGVAKLAVSYYGVPVTSLTFDACTQFGITCPMKAGSDFKGGIQYRVPAIPLTGVTLDIQIDVIDASGNPISCLKTQAKVVQ